MNQNLRLTLSSAALLAGLLACSKSEAPKVAAPAAPPPAGAPMAAAPMGMPAPAGAPAAGAMASGTVVETFDASSYTYVRVKTASGEIWAAASQFKVSKGEKVSVPLTMPMENFHSSTLNRTFPVIYFTPKVYREGELPAAK